MGNGPKADGVLVQQVKDAGHPVQPQVLGADSERLGSGGQPYGHVVANKQRGA